jgi:uncharacterized protein YukE
MLADLESLTQFISQLQQFNNELSESSSNLTSHFATLGESWQDAQYQKFASEWEQALNTIRGYLQSAPDYVGHLQTKARQVSEYLDT